MTKASVPPLESAPVIQAYGSLAPARLNLSEVVRAKSDEARWILAERPLRLPEPGKRERNTQKTLFSRSSIHVSVQIPGATFQR